MISLTLIGITERKKITQINTFMQVKSKLFQLIAFLTYDFLLE